MPSQFYFGLARIAEYQADIDEAGIWWQMLKDYIDEEYDTEEQVDLSLLDGPLQEIVSGYEEWRNELYGAAESALQDEEEGGG